MSQPLIDLQHISKSFDGELILDDLNLSIRENSFVLTWSQRLRKDHCSAYPGRLYQSRYRKGSL